MVTLTCDADDECYLKELFLFEDHSSGSFVIGFFHLEETSDCLQ
jgi:hypothetical protein